MRKKPGDKAFRVSFKFSTHGLDQSLADFNRFSDTETRSCYSCLVLFDHFVGLALKGLGLLLRLWHMSTWIWEWSFLGVDRSRKVLRVRQLLCKKCPYSELFWSAFSRIRTEYGEIRSTHIQLECGKIWTRITPNTDTFHAANLWHTHLFRKKGRTIWKLWLSFCPVLSKFFLEKGFLQKEFLSNRKAAWLER